MIYLRFLVDESNNADGEKNKSKSSKQKRKSNTLAENGRINQSNEIEDGRSNTPKLYITVHQTCNLLKIQLCFIILFTL